MPYQKVQEPIAEPLALDEAKLHLRVDVTDDDSLISAMISVAREYAETITRRSFVSTQWKLVIDSFPGPTLMGIPWGKPFTLPAHAILLEKSKVEAVTAINYTAMDGTAQVMPAANYTVDYTSEPCRITPVFGQIWPIPLPQIGAVEVDFVSGYAAPITASVSPSEITIGGNWKTYAVGDSVRFSLADAIGGKLPAPLQLGVTYYIQSVVSPGVYTLAATSGGTQIALTDTGSGTAFIGVVPEGIKSWMKLRIGSMYQHREEFALTEKGSKLEPLPFVDRLLDPYRVVF